MTTFFITPAASFNRRRLAFTITMLAAVLIPSGGFLYAQAGAAGVYIPLEANNNHGNQTSLRIGVHELASNGIDEALGERELPPAPPVEIYDARFIPPGSGVTLGEGSVFDLRPWRSGSTFSENFRLLFQAGRTWPSITLKLPASLPSGVKQIRIDGKSVKAGDSVVSLLPSGTMNIIVDFDLSPPTVTAAPAKIVFTLNPADTVPPPAKPVRITPSTTGGTWNASPNQDWITLDKTTGAGEADLIIGINRITFPEGVNSGEVEIRALGNDDPVVITVDVDMPSPVHEAGAIHDFSIVGVFPNPAVSGNTARVDFTANPRAAASLEVIDLLGRVRARFSGGINPGTGTRSLKIALMENNGQRPLPPGAYYLRLYAGGSTAVRSLIIR